MKKSWTYHLLAALSFFTLLSVVSLSNEAHAVCSSEERIDMAMSGMSEWEIDAECNARGPIVGTVCDTLQGKCRLSEPQPFWSSCVCQDSYGHEYPGQTVQY
jgi:hypothetical protein